ncbi:MAG: hypothetical protein R3C11_18870 [Planctomycetaceae bacterium]
MNSHDAEVHESHPQLTPLKIIGAILLLLCLLGVFMWFQARQKINYLERMEAEGKFYSSSIYPSWVYQYGLDGVLPESYFQQIDMVQFESDKEVEEFRRYFEFSDLSDISLYSEQITNRTVSLLGDIENLNFLYISSTSIDDAGLQQLSSLTGIQSLLLSGGNLTDAAFRNIQQATALNTISLHDMQLTDESISHLIKNRKISSYYISSVPLTSQGIDKLLEASVLINLNLSGLATTELSTAQIERLAQHQELQALGLDLNFSLTDFSHLARLPALTELKIVKVELTDNELLMLQSTNMLESLELRGKEITAKGLSHVLRNQGMFRLRLIEIPITAEVAQLLALQDYYGIEFESTSITREVAELMPGLGGGCDSLALRHVMIEPGVIAELINTGNLTDITIDHTQPGDEDFEALKDLQEDVSFIALIGIEISESQFEILKSLTNLSAIWTEKTNLTDQQLDELKEALPDCEFSY